MVLAFSGSFMDPLPLLLPPRSAGKTLQSITILWTLMTQGRAGTPEVTHTIVTCPVSLVTNWESELNTKWVKEARLRAKGIQIIAVTPRPGNKPCVFLL
jgi:DNA repair and recombination RAD54-like protein